DLADLDLAAFALQTNFARRNVAAGRLVHELAVDVRLDRVAGADDFVGVPFADGLLVRLTIFLHAAVRGAAMFLERGSVDHIEIALVTGLSLALDALRPDFVGF